MKKYHLFYITIVQSLPRAGKYRNDYRFSHHAESASILGVEMAFLVPENGAEDGRNANH